MRLQNTYDSVINTLKVLRSLKLKTKDNVDLFECYCFMTSTPGVILHKAWIQQQVIVMFLTLVTSQEPLLFVE